jgi:hypothetical protein
MRERNDVNVPRRSLIKHHGFPKELMCLVCQRPRLASSPGDRLHPACRVSASKLDTGPGEAPVVWR